jgi:hypothetical protein
MENAPDLEAKACRPVPLDPNGFNPKTNLPYVLKVDHIRQSMQEFLDFLGFINQQLNTKSLPRLETFLMTANFSSLVGEFMNMSIPKYCKTLVKNKYHNGHPDLLPAGVFPNDSVLHGEEGIEIKGSRHSSGWQGHNPENVWLMVFVFDSNTSHDGFTGIIPRPFRFVEVLGAAIIIDDWNFSGRSETSRRTITASVTRRGYDKMAANWIYRDQR